MTERYGEKPNPHKCSGVYANKRTQRETQTFLVQWFISNNIAADFCRPLQLTFHSRWLFSVVVAVVIVIHIFSFCSPSKADYDCAACTLTSHQKAKEIIREQKKKWNQRVNRWQTRPFIDFGMFIFHQRKMINLCNARVVGNRNEQRKNYASFPFQLCAQVMQSIEKRCCSHKNRFRSLFVHLPN